MSDDELLDLAVRTARAAGAELLSRYGRPAGVETKSTDTDLVSDADRAAEALIVAALSAARPDDGLFGEEGAARPSTSGLTWIIDPLDGTVNYLYQLANFAVSIACADADGSRVGVVYDPVSQETFTAIRGGGSYLCTASGTRRLTASTGVPISRAMVATGFGYDATVRARQGALIGALLPRVRDIRRIGSAALDICAVAAGRVDAYVEEGIHPWDMAAGSLVCTEAGALFTEVALPGCGPTYLAAAPDLHAALDEMVRELATGSFADQAPLPAGQ